ncbi:MAG: hypothetical protein R2824_35420 [Saprospiraceae bacterium]
MRKHHAPENGLQAETTLQDFTDQELSPDQLLRLKGGDGEDPPPEEGIGHEDVIDL